MKTYPILWKVKDIKEPFERNEIILQGIKDLISSEPNYANFFRILHDKILSYIQLVGIKTLPRHLSNLVENITRTIDVKLNDIVNYVVIYIEHDDSEVAQKYTDIKRITSPVRFKDSTDYDIFCEIVMNLSNALMVSFYTDDKDFQKRGNKAYSLLERDLAFDSSWLNLVHTDELT